MQFHVTSEHSETKQETCTVVCIVVVSHVLNFIFKPFIHHTFIKAYIQVHLKACVYTCGKIIGNSLFGNVRTL